MIFSSTITAVLYYFEDLFPAHYIFYLFLTNLPLFIAGFVCYFLLLEKFSIPAWVVIGIMLLVMLVPYIIRNPSFFCNGAILCFTHFSVREKSFKDYSE